MKRDSNTPSVSLAFPPLGWASTAPHEAQMTTVCACEKIVVMAKQAKKKSKTRALRSIWQSTYLNT